MKFYFVSMVNEQESKSAVMSLQLKNAFPWKLLRERLSTNHAEEKRMFKLAEGKNITNKGGIYLR